MEENRGVEELSNLEIPSDVKVKINSLMYCADDLKDLLLKMGLSKQQTENKTITKLIDAIAEDNYIPTELLAARVKELERDLNNTAYRFRERNKEYESVIKRGEELENRLKDLSTFSLTISSTDAKDVLALWAAMLGVAENYDVDMNKAAESIGYVLYALFGGQAARINIGEPKKEV